VGDSSAHANTDEATGLVGATKFLVMFNIALCLLRLKYDVVSDIIFTLHVGANHGIGNNFPTPWLRLRFTCFRRELRSLF